MKIIQATEEHLNQLVPLFDQYMVFYKQPSNPSRYEEYLTARLANDEATIYMAVDDKDNGIGFVLNYQGFSSVSQGEVVILNDLFVVKDQRGKGVAEKLIQCSFDLARERGAIRVDLGTAKDNVTAQKLYERLGFQRDTEFYNYSYAIRK